MISLPGQFHVLSKDLQNEIISSSQEMHVPAGQQIIRAGQFIHSVPMVLEGLVKVWIQHEDRDVLLYYIKPGESCVMTISTGMDNEPSRIYGATEVDSTILAIPMDKVNRWILRDPHLSLILFKSYHDRFSELLETINLVLFYRMDSRILDYLKERSKLLSQNPMKISHREIANDIGTAREVVSRVLKKLEKEGHIHQTVNSIEIKPD